MKKKLISIAITAQPTDVSCGPTCLHAIYDYYNDPISLDQVIQEVPQYDTGGTLAVHLACHALKRGYQVITYTYNLHIFDPTWFQQPPLSRNALKLKLQQQAAAKNRPKLTWATEAYLKYLEMGGQLRFHDLTSRFIRSFLVQDIPILTGLSATFLYQAPREYVNQGKQIADDVRGEPEGHFVLLSGYDHSSRKVWVSDPFNLNPYSDTLRYSIGMNRLLTALSLGILTDDANILIITTKKTKLPR